MSRPRETANTRISARQRFRYWFDNTMSGGTPALIGWLFAISAIAVLVISALIVWADDKQSTSVNNAMRAIWKNTVNTFNLGSGDEVRPLLVVLTIGLAAAGIFFASTLISLLTSGVNKKIMDLRKGRSLVLEKNHTVIVGWSDQVFTLIAELVEANASRKHSAIAILADQDRTDMEDAIRDRLGSHLRGTRVICRTGNPIDSGDIDLVNPQQSRSIIVPSPPGDSPDRQVIKTLLAITNSPNRRARPYHIVTAVTEADNHAAATLAGGAETIVVNADDIAARVVVQTCRQPGLSVVYTDLLDFGGDEVYMVPEPRLVGETFGDALLAYDESSVIGLLQDDKVLLKPAMNTVIGPSDQIIAISEDDDTLIISETTPGIDRSVFAPASEFREEPESALLLGWNRRASAMIEQLDAYVAPGSVLMVAAQGEEAAAEVHELEGTCRNLRISFIEGDPSKRAVLEGLEPGRYHHIIVLCYDNIDAQQADSQTLTTLLHLRDMEDRAAIDFEIVSEMIDERNRRLAEITKAEDFVVSYKLISLLMTQLSENRRLAAVFEDLFDPEGAEIYIKPVETYVVTGRPMSFHTVVAGARQYEEVAIGYRIAAESTKAPLFGVRLNPGKQNPITFAPGDRIIVLAED